MNLRQVRQAIARREAIAERALSRRVGATERELLGIYRGARNEVRSALSEAIERYAVDGVLTDAEMSKYGRMGKLEKELNQAIGKANGQAHRTTNRLIDSQFENAFAQRAAAIERAMGRGLPWGRFSQDAVRAAVESPLADIAFERLRTDSRQRIRRTLAQGMIRGDSYTDMAREIGQVINGSASDAVRIARTEAHRVQNVAATKTTEKLQDMGIEIRKEWVAVEDDRTRDRHEAMNGELADSDGWFTLGDGTRTQAPGMSGEAHHDINCRCRYIDVPVEIPEAIEQRTQEPRDAEELL